MRIISQDGTIDVPYNFFSLSVASGKCKDVEYACIYCHNISAPHGTKLAEYSSKEKAIKAMEMLREQYERLEVFKVLASGATEHMEKSLTYEELVKYNQSYREMNVFQFPKDDEVEV
jgi:hypothetical protein